MEGLTTTNTITTTAATTMITATTDAVGLNLGSAVASSHMIHSTTTTTITPTDQEENVGNSSRNHSRSSSSRRWKKSSGVRDEKQAEVEAEVAVAVAVGGNQSAKEAAAMGGKSTPSVAYYRLFSQADALDCLLMLVGGTAAAAHGASLPVFLLFLGKLIDSLGTMSADMPTEVIKVPISPTLTFPLFLSFFLSFFHSFILSFFLSDLTVSMVS